METLIDKIRLKNIEKNNLDNEMMEIYLKSISQDEETLKETLARLEWAVEGGKRIVAEMNEGKHL